MRVEELDVEVFATAFKSDQQKVGFRAVVPDGSEYDCVKACDAKKPRASGQRYSARRRKPGTDPGKAAWPDRRYDKVEGGGHLPSFAHCLVHQGQQRLGLAVHRIDTLLGNHLFAETDRHRAGQTR